MIPKTKLDQWCDAVMEAGWLAALVVAPLFFNVFSSRVFEPDKISLIRTISLLMALAWLVKVAGGGPAWLPAFRRNADIEGDTSVEHTSNWRFWRVPFLAPILLLVVAYAISTIFSVAPFVSWFGSYQRLQGSYTLLSYVIIALLTMAHLRSPNQIRRLQHVVVLTSLPISIYGIIQHYAIDPLPWGGDTTQRIAANAGNAIFLSAYLIMAFFFTLERVYSSFAYLLSGETKGERQELPASLAGGAYLFVLFVQMLAIFWTQSRGPLLGLLAGLYLFILLLFSALRPRGYRALTAGWVGIGIAGAVFLVLLNTTGVGQTVASVPSLRRLSTLLDLESNTAQVRVLIWQGAEDMVRPHEPLIRPDGNTDTLNALRPLIGYGPEAMWIAYNPFYPPNLAHYEARNASPDRSHNETWDSLVITGVLGFLAYMALFISIFYWALRWLGLLVNRRDKILFAALLTFFSVALVIIFYRFDGSWRFFGVALPAGLILGVVSYVTLAAFMHGSFTPDRRDLPRQLLILTILATIVAHFVEIHFGIAIVATRTYFWIQTALLLALGMRWSLAQPFAVTQEVEAPAGQEANRAEPEQVSRGKARRKRRPVRQRHAVLDGLPSVPRTVMTDILVFLTFVFIYTTNARGLESMTAILLSSVTKLIKGGADRSSPALLILMIFTWLIAATLGMVTASLRQRRAPNTGWWLRGYGLHALIVWGLWLLYGLFQSRRLIPGITGTDLNSQLDLVAGHFAVYTWLIVVWVFVTGTVFAWPWLRSQQLPVAKRGLLGAAAGVGFALLIFFVVSNVNVALVRADVVYKQGQQFDSQRNWLSSVELYRRALRARTTEDHYMLFLGRSLLEQAKQTPVEGVIQLPPEPSIDDVLALEPADISQMDQQSLLRAAEAVLLEAQRVNPLNTDHTANLARLYRTWADLSRSDADLAQEMLDRSIGQYDTAVTLSPNAAHLWNEKGNAHLARGERDLAEAAYLHSLDLDPVFAQTYLLLSDFYEGEEDYEQMVTLLEDGIERMDATRRQKPTPQMFSYLGVALARNGDRQGAINANMEVLERSPNDYGAMRNLAILYRDQDDPQEAIAWAEKGAELAANGRPSEAIQLRQLAAELYQQMDQPDQVLAQYEIMRELDGENTGILRTLSTLYVEREEWNRAVEVLQALSALDTAEFRHPLAIAQILQQVGQEGDALPFAQRALDLAPTDQKPAVEQLIAELNAAGQ